MIKVKIIIPIIIVIIISAALIIFNADEDANKNKVDDEWIKSGPFEIDKSEYNMGEKIFLNTNDLLPEEKGTIQFLRPINDTHHKSYIQIPFDGMSKDNFNYYFEPGLNQYKGLCSMDDFVGTWIVKFVGTEYEDINFKVNPQSSSWDERTFEPVC
jgi:hypothetical protein|tara:strand:- start:9 stop:476 length:468 start_codon:yes stop_codon:yes gene_type:complete